MQRAVRNQRFEKKGEGLSLKVTYRQTVGLMGLIGLRDRSVPFRRQLIPFPQLNCQPTTVVAESSTRPREIGRRGRLRDARRGEAPSSSDDGDAFLSSNGSEPSPEECHRFRLSTLVISNHNCKLSFVFIFTAFSRVNRRPSPEVHGPRRDRPSSLPLDPTNRRRSPRPPARRRRRRAAASASVRSERRIATAGVASSIYTHIHRNCPSERLIG